MFWTCIRQANGNYVSFTFYDFGHNNWSLAEPITIAEVRELSSHSTGNCPGTDAFLRRLIIQLLVTTIILVT